MMTGASRDSLAASLEAVGPVLDEGGVALARELFGALDVVDEHGALRRALTDPAWTTVRLKASSSPERAARPACPPRAASAAAACTATVSRASPRSRSADQRRPARSLRTCSAPGVTRAPNSESTRP